MNAWDEWRQGLQRRIAREKELAAEELARGINESSFGTHRWESAPEGYREVRRIESRVILAELESRGWRLVR